MKTYNIIWLFVLILLLVISLFFFFGESAGKPKDDLGSQLSCQNEKISDSVLALSSQSNLIKAFVSFRQLPLTAEQQQKLKDLGVYLDQQTLTFDYMWGTIPVANLCALAEEENVKSIFTLRK